jgi:hypothetical protein
LTGATTITADASDDVAVVQVEFLVDGSSLGVDSDGGDGWSVDWDTTLAPDGAVSVTAIATDTADQTGTDSIAVSVDNAGPSVTITAPVDGATLSGAVPVVADTGTDPTVIAVEFFAGGSSIGVDADGSDGWSQVWDTTATGDGPTTLSATATDTMSRTGSDALTVTVDNAAVGIVTMVVGNAASLASVDVAIRDRLVADGYAVTIVDDNVAAATDAIGASLVYVSSSINSTVLGAALETVAVPVWVAKPYSLDDMGMTGSNAGVDYGTTKSNMVTIVDDAHPLAAGFSGDVVVASAARTLSWGLPAGGAAIVATSNGFATSFVYQGGDLLADGSTAAGCRLHVSAFQTAVLSWNADAWTIFDAAVSYAANGCQ